jgi:hypothetical protein
MVGKNSNIKGSIKATDEMLHSVTIEIRHRSFDFKSINYSFNAFAKLAHCCLCLIQRQQ